jgi:hypothetical protein
LLRCDAMSFSVSCALRVLQLLPKDQRGIGKGSCRQLRSRVFRS